MSCKLDCCPLVRISRRISVIIKRDLEPRHIRVCVHGWMERCFKGRSQAIRFFTTPLQWTPKSLQIKKLIDSCDLFELKLDALVKDGFVKAVYIKPSLFDGHYFSMEDRKKYYSYGADEPLIKLKSVKEIDCKYHQTWDVCDDSLGLRMVPLQYYVLVIKNGVIPPKYLRKVG